MKINIVGGGPAGLYFALLMKKAEPGCDITVLERDGPDDTFGWGIVFSDRTMAYLSYHDDETHRAIEDTFETWDNVDVIHRGQKITIRGNRFSGIARLAFLNILRRRCLELGVTIQFNTNVSTEDLPSLAEADLLVGADGANSLLRREFAERFRPTVELRRNRYIWLGTRRLFHGLTLTFKTHGGGAYASHAYQFDRTTSTFIVECSEDTWTKAGFERMSDDDTCGHLAGVFGDELEGRPLLSNNFVKWLRFPLIRNDCWHAGNMVLLGDALHTAHFSIGSGTKLALEDAIALYQCFRPSSRVPEALAEFERVRRPVIDAYQAAAQSSMTWFEEFEQRMHLEPIELAHELMTRSGRIDDASLRRRDPAFWAAYEAWRKGR
ncbi:MAG: FAD-dependent monooxygenase [Phycisphaerae bacterium]